MRGENSNTLTLSDKIENIRDMSVLQSVTLPVVMMKCVGYRFRKKGRALTVKHLELSAEKVTFSSVTCNL